MQRVLVLVVLTFGCGGGTNAQNDARAVDGHTLDGHVIDAHAIDAHAADAHLGDAHLGDAHLVSDAPHALPDAMLVCDVLTQTGCSTSEKCTWIHDETTPTPLGHVGCAANGSVALGNACTFGADGPQGFDNCLRGDVCVSGACVAICDLQGGSPTCTSSHACAAYTGLFDAGQAGVCAHTCDPIADNDFLGSGTKPGTSCAAGEGCYGFPGTSLATTYTCSKDINTTLVHRSACTTLDGCAPNGSTVYLNGCAEGYVPLLDDTTGSSQADCIAYCQPADCWSGGCPNQQLRGAAPHDCTTASARGTFDVASSGGSNGDQCFYSWGFEYDSNGTHIPSPTSNTVGYCIDHTKYQYDSNNDGQITSADAVWPRCDTLAIGSAVNNGYDATYFGCVSTTTATAQGNPPALPPHRPVMDLPRAPYHAVARTH